MTQSWGKRSIALDARIPEDLALIRRLADQADIIVENQLAGFWKGAGLDFEAMRADRPALIVCSVTGFGQTGPWAKLPSHGLNMDALADTLNVDWEDGKPHRGWVFTSWGNELGTSFAATAICAALASVRGGGEGAWIDLSCWDALVGAHRVEIAMTTSTGEAVLDAHRFSPDDVHDLLVEGWCAGPAGHVGAEVLEAILRTYRPRRSHRPTQRGEFRLRRRRQCPSRRAGGEFAKATANEWLQRFVDWDVPGGPVLDVPAIMKTDHYQARSIAGRGEAGWPNVATAIRWHHADTRAGAGLQPPPPTTSTAGRFSTNGSGLAPALTNRTQRTSGRLVESSLRLHR